MPEPAQPVFLVDAYADPAVVRVCGRASLLNSPALKEFFAALMGRGKSRFVVDFKSCTGMDSTFLGVLAGAALQLRRLNPPGSLTLVRLNERNLELVRNLGLHRLATVDVGGAPAAGEMQALDASRRGQIESARVVLEAHENLVATDPENAAKFQDVIAFLRNELGSR